MLPRFTVDRAFNFACFTSRSTAGTFTLWKHGIEKGEDWVTNQHSFLDTMSLSCQHLHHFCPLRCLVCRKLSFCRSLLELEAECDRYIFRSWATELDWTGGSVAVIHHPICSLADERLKRFPIELRQSLFDDRLFFTGTAFHVHHVCQRHSIRGPIFTGAVKFPIVLIIPVHRFCSNKPAYSQCVAVIWVKQMVLRFVLRTQKWNSYLNLLVTSSANFCKAHWTINFSVSILDTITLPCESRSEATVPLYSVANRRIRWHSQAINVVARRMELPPSDASLEVDKISLSPGSEFLIQNKLYQSQVSKQDRSISLLGSFRDRLTSCSVTCDKVIFFARTSSPMKHMFGCVCNAHSKAMWEADRPINRTKWYFFGR